MAAGGDMPGFVTETGTGGFTHLVDETGELWERFGADDRATFLLVDDDGTTVRAGFGTMDQESLTTAVERLLAG